MAALDLCPVEMLQQIFSSLSCSDLRAVCQTSSSLCSVAQPLLYSSIELTWKESQTPPIAPLLSTLLRKPDLAAHVKTLKMDGDAFLGPDIWYSRQPPKISIAREHLAEFTACIDAMQLPNGHEWVQTLKQGTVDALNALLVSRLPNLSSLHLESGIVKESHFLGEMLTFALCEPEQKGRLPTFQQLRRVHFFPALSGYSWLMPGNTKDVLALLYLPSLEHLHARLDSPLYFSWPSASGTPPACNSLTSMKLTGVREGPLGHLLRATKRLDVLEWEWWYDPHAHDLRPKHLIHRNSTDLIDLDQITADLSHVKSTLRSLSISVACGEDDNGALPDLTIQGSLDALRDFGRLTHLEVPLILLVGFTRHGRDRLDICFPVGLESLTINDDGYPCPGYDWPDFIVLPLIEAWLAHWRKWTPRLRKLTWLLKVTDEDWGPVERDQLRDACFSAGVAVEIIRWQDEMPRFRNPGTMTINPR
ncbi:hypothetical protein OQA88_13181 [Cercophora sp. LCS_1]